jgi:hypothetical protein
LQIQKHNPSIDCSLYLPNCWPLSSHQYSERQSSHISLPFLPPFTLKPSVFVRYSLMLCTVVGLCSCFCPITELKLLWTRWPVTSTPVIKWVVLSPYISKMFFCILSWWSLSKFFTPWHPCPYTSLLLFISPDYICLVCLMLSEYTRFQIWH